MLGVARRGRKDSDFEKCVCFTDTKGRLNHIRAADRALSLTLDVALTSSGRPAQLEDLVHGTSFFLTS